MSHQIGGFEEFLYSFRRLSALAAGSAAICTPLIVGFASIAPPWPPAILPATSLTQIIVLIFVYRTLRRVRQSAITKIMAIMALCAAILFLGYLGLLSEYSFTIPTNGERVSRGLECTDDAKITFAAKCPDLGLAEIRTANYQADLLWTSDSIMIVRLGLIVVWLLAFGCLSTMFGSFLVKTQSLVDGREPSAKRKR